MNHLTAFISTVALASGVAFAAEPGLPIFTAEQRASHYVWFPKDGELLKPDPRVRIEADGLTFLDVPATDEPQEFGYLATRQPMRNYRVMFEYEWGKKRFAPRATALRDSGLLYHMRGPDAIWPNCAECQVQEGETGDTFLLWQKGAPSASSHVANGADRKFAPNGELKAGIRGRITRSETADTLTGWNEVEVIVEGAAASHRVNGREVNRLWDLRWPEGESATEGKLALQVEGAEVRYRNVRVAPLSWPTDHKPFRVLVFSKTMKFRHDSIPDAVAAVKALGAQFGFTVDATEDAAAFAADNLKQFAVVMFLNTTGDVLAPEQERALEQFVKGGGGFVGVHSACDTEYDWPWYGNLVGTYFKDHPKIQDAVVRLNADATSPSASILPREWPRRDEWYNFVKAPTGVDVVLTLDESTYEGGKMGAQHPLTWQHAFDGGRSWYTAMGHTKETYREPLFLLHLLGGIQYAAGLPAPGPVLDVPR
ncbi:MAG TPA: ThuA domain-containing protein [Tepidisphaeraceae bacterium]|jgi:hypothetical protein|nr:ThuA domain-containing protein [Tepidisphaeraceae bacterium]